MDSDLAGLDHLAIANNDKPGVTHINGIHLPLIQQGNAGCGCTQFLVPVVGFTEGLYRIPLSGLDRCFHELYKLPGIDPRVNTPGIPAADPISDAQGVQLMMNEKTVLTAAVSLIGVG